MVSLIHRLGSLVAAAMCACRLCITACCVYVTLGSPTLHADQMQLQGDFIQGGLIQGRTGPRAEVKVAGRRVRVSSEGFFLIGFGRDAPVETQLVITHPDGNSEQRLLRITQRDYVIQRIDGLPPRKVTPSEKDLARIRADAELAKKTRLRDDPRTDFAAGFRWPLRGRISGVYGSQRILNGEARQPHYGVDIAAPQGTIVRAPAGGVVTMYHDMFFSGGTLIIDHGHGLSSSFLHLHKALVQPGQRVRQGDPIAEVGSTGRASGPHLDWRINLFDQRLDPELLVPPMPAG